MQMSIIIPTYNEAKNISRVLKRLREYSTPDLKEIIVIDGESEDDTVQIAKTCGADIACISPQKGRAAQMNYGVSLASGDVYYFVHADTLPPKSYIMDIHETLEQGYPMGCYRFQFDSASKLLKINAWFTRFDRLMCRGGDQTLFVTRDLFEEMNGYRDDFRIMEEYDFLTRARKVAQFRIIPKDVIVSARKYDNNSYLRVNLANFTVFMMYFMGFSQDRLVKVYKWMLDYR